MFIPSSLRFCTQVKSGFLSKFVPTNTFLKYCKSNSEISKQHQIWFHFSNFICIFTEFLDPLPKNHYCSCFVALYLRILDLFHRGGLQKTVRKDWTNEIVLLVFGLLEKCQHFDYSITNGRMTVFGTLLFSQSEEMSPLDLAKPCFVFLLQFYFILFLELFSLLYVVYFFSSWKKQKYSTNEH